MKRQLAMVAMVLFLGAGPATQPASRPAVGVTIADDAPPEIKAYFEAVLKYRDERRRRIAEIVKSDEETYRSLQRSRDVSAEIVATAKNEWMKSKAAAKEAAAPDFLPVITPITQYSDSGLVSDLKAGWIGNPSTSRIIQIVDEHSALVRLVVVDATNTEVSYLTVLYAGIDTKGLVDGSRFEYPGIAVAGTYTYQTPDRTKATVLRFDPIEFQKYVVVIRR